MFDILKSNGITNKEEFLHQIKTQAKFATLSYMWASEKVCTVQLEFTLNRKRWEFIKDMDITSSEQDNFAAIYVAGHGVSSAELNDLVTKAIRYFQQLSYKFDV